MDKTIRRNEKCVIGLPRCDFVFSSTRTCFIAYGFEDSPLEKDIVYDLLESSGIQPVEADAQLAPGQSAFCAKICSKIITSQFCIVLLNNDEKNGIEIPNANVNMEYGLMLGFNKYIIPFQKESQKLPFNVAGLDTVKYTDKNFKSRARDSIKQAIQETEQNETNTSAPDQFVDAFLLTKKLLVSSLNDQGEKDLFGWGNQLGFNLVNDFSGLKYSYLGVFTAFRVELIVLRVRFLEDILNGRKESMKSRYTLGIINDQQMIVGDHLFNTIKFIIIVNSDDDKESAKSALSFCSYPIEIYSMSDVVDSFNEFTRS